MKTWSYRGTSLDGLGIVTLVSDSLKMPTRRGGNILVPYRHGRLHVEKYYDQRTMTLGLEVAMDSLEDLEARIDTIKALLGGRGLGLLTQTLDDLTQRTIWAEYTGDLELARISPLCARLALDFTCPAPFFRSTTLTSATETIDASPKAMTVTNPGTVEERDPVITLTGPLENTEITNSTNGYVLRYNAAIASPRVVTIQTVDGQYVATTDLGANVIGNVTHEGGSALMALEAGDNVMSIEDDEATTGTVGFTFYAPYL